MDAEKVNARIAGGRFVRTRKVFRNKLRLHVSIHTRQRSTEYSGEY